jgi:hypothetical protein
MPAVVMPAVVVVASVIFVDPCLVKRTKVFRQPSGSDEGAGAIRLRGSQRRLRAGTIRSPAAPPRMAIRGGAFLSEHTNDTCFRYYKGGLASWRIERTR